MVFASVPFLFYFLPVLLAAYFAVPRTWRAARNSVLLVFSLLFYAWGEGLLVGLLVLSALANHLVAKLIHARPDKARAALAAGVALNLGGLAWFKYAGLAAETAGIEGFNGPHLPLGISFFSFQAISYLVDVSRQEAEPARSPLGSLLYIASFPQLIAGPIVRFRTVAAELSGREESVALFASGVRLFVLGLAQKVLIANLAAGPADTVFGLPPSELTAALAWAGAAAYALQIFFDFAGYSNMAMGLGLMFGFRFPRNFDYPYASRSVTEFWRRWHVTLSTWFRDYLYVPLGGNRRGGMRTVLNLWVVFLLCGLWHGAAWTFVAWGAYQGAFLTLERVWLARRLARMPRIAGHLYLVLAVLFGWVLFRSETMAHALSYYAAMLGLGDAAGGQTLAYAFPGLVWLWLLLGAAFATPLAERLAASLTMRRAPGASRLAGSGASLAGLALLFVASVAFVAGGAYNPFIYFRF
jgi:alginate O-acetyltransferase complex protein AlgI